MNRHDFSIAEIEALCDLYFEARLSHREEEALATLLGDNSALTPKMSETLKVMALEDATGLKKQPIARRARHRWIAGVAASFLILATAALSVFLKPVATDNTDDGTYVVWQNGQRITGAEAKKLAEEREQIDMEMLRKVMREQRKALHGTYASIDADEIE